MTRNPWRYARSRPEVTIEWRVLEGGFLGISTGHGLIVMHPHQSQRQRRCTITHELVHTMHGHVSCAPDTECYARREAARFLITIDQLLDVLAWTEEIEEAAEELHVDLGTMKDRIEALTADERALLVARCMEVERGA